MRLSIPINDLQRLAGAGKLEGLAGRALIERLREVFGFLPEDTEIEVDESGFVHVDVPPTPDEKKASAQRLAGKAGRSAKKGDYAKAKKAYEQALSLDPTLTDARRDLAMLCSQTGDHEAAKDHLIDVLRVSPGDPWAYVILANHYAKAESNIPMAVSLLERAVEIAPQDPYAHNSLAATLMEEGRIEQALEHFDIALRALPSLANALYGRAIIHVRQQNFKEAEGAFEILFRDADLSDPRNSEMLRDARSTFIKVENILANDRREESAKAVRVLRARAGEVSGYPVEEGTDALPAHIGGTIRMAWKHGRDHHELLLRGGDYPEILRHHITAHELHHLLFESTARAGGRNVWFTVDDNNRRAARAGMAPALEKIARSGVPSGHIDSLFDHFFRGITNMIYNAPVDMRIERTIRENHPQLKQAQFCGVVQMAHEASNATFSEKVRSAFPAAMLRLNDALNTASALFIDDLFDGATAWAEPYRKLPAFKEGRELYQLWRELDPEVPEGDEARLVDAFAEHLRIRDWYTWKPDPANRS